MLEELEEKKQVGKQEEVKNSDREGSGVVGLASIQQRTINEGKEHRVVGGVASILQLTSNDNM